MVFSFRYIKICYIQLSNLCARSGETLTGPPGLSASSRWSHRYNSTVSAINSRVSRQICLSGKLTDVLMRTLSKTAAAAVTAAWSSKYSTYRWDRMSCSIHRCHSSWMLLCASTTTVHRCFHRTFFVVLWRCVGDNLTWKASFCRAHSPQSSIVRLLSITGQRLSVRYNRPALCCRFISTCTFHW